MNIQQAVAEDYTLVGTGRFLKSVEHSSLVVDTEKQIFYWNSKRIFGNIADWYRKVKKQPFIEKVDLFEACQNEVEVVVDLPDSSLINLFNARALETDYWTNYRHYTRETIARFSLGYSGEWHTIPIYENGRFVNFQCRKNQPKAMRHWYKNVGPHTFNFSILPFVKDYIVITESPVDAIMLDQYNIPAVSQTAGSGNTLLFSKNMVKFSNIKRIFIVYDNDNAGELGSLKVKDIFGDRAKTFTFTGFSNKYDVTDFFKDGHSRDEFCNLIGV